ncbi:MAG: sulfite exporter TauE/SafE family protein [Saccharofermentanales bacterium]
MNLILFFVSFLASVVGAICGIGGGVIIKPLLDSLSIASVSTISFLSGCTVLGMTLYSVSKSIRSGDSQVDYKIATPLAIGAAFGGVAGKYLYTSIKDASPDPELVGAYQAIALAVITVGTLIYTIFKDKVKTHQLTNKVACLVIGLLLGMMSSFLGIGGGPINLVVLYFFFSMSTKIAAQNSLYIILLSQITSVLSTILAGEVPEFSVIWLVIMVIGGIGGGIAGRYINTFIDDAKVNKLFIGLMVVIIGISIYNSWRFLNVS